MSSRARVGIAEAILAAVENGGRPAGAAGAGAGGRPAPHRGTAIDHAFAMVAEGRWPRGRQVELVVVPVRLTCRSCGHDGTSVDPLRRLPRLRRHATSTPTGGDDLVLESIQMAEAARCAWEFPGEIVEILPDQS